jgi:hypothetical protein
VAAVVTVHITLLGLGYLVDGQATQRIENVSSSRPRKLHLHCVAFASAFPCCLIKAFGRSSHGIAP